MQRFANNAASTLAGAIDGVVTALAVTSAATFPTGPKFPILVDAELMLVSGVVGAVFTLVRGVEGTAASAHANLVPVINVLTAGQLEAAIAEPDQVTTAGTTAGNAISAMPVQQPTEKKFKGFLNGYQNARGTPQTITFPTPFTQVPVFTVNSDPHASTPPRLPR